MGGYRDRIATGSGPFIQPQAGAVLRTMLTKNRDIINARDFGADEAASGADNSTFMQAAIDAAAFASLASGGWAYLPRGVFTINTTLQLKARGARIKADGTVLVAGTAGMTMLRIGNHTAGPNFYLPEDIEIDGLKFEGSTIGARAILFEGCHTSVLRNIRIQNFTGDGIAINDEIYTLMLDTVRVEFCNRGVHIFPTGIASQDKITLVNCNLTDNTLENLLVETVNTLHVIGGSYERGTKGIAITGNCRNVNLIGPHCETNSIVDIDFYKDTVASAAAACVGFEISAGLFNGTGVGPKAIRIMGAVGGKIGAIFSQNHTTGCLDISNTGLSGVVNVDIEISTIGGIQDATAVIKEDGCSFNSRVRNLITSLSTSAEQRFTALGGAASDWSVLADSSFGAGFFAWYSRTAALYRMVMDNLGHIAFGSQVAPQVSCCLDLSLFTDGALMLPKITTAQETALTKDSGMLWYNTTLGRYRCYEAGVLKTIVTV